MFDRFLDSTNAVLRCAGRESAVRGERFIGSEHLLLGLLDYEYGIVGEVFGLVGLSYEQVSDELSHLLASPSWRSIVTSPVRDFTPTAYGMLESAAEQATQLGCHSVHPEHVLLGITERVSADDSSVAAVLLRAVQLESDALRRAAHEVITYRRGALTEES